MPESFLKDESVPARWRILGIINGFLINGGCFYGSNEWLMEQLGCSEPTVSSAFKELEALKEVRIERTRRTRKVYRNLRDPSQLGSETQVGCAGDPSQLVPNSVSNSVREITDFPSENALPSSPEEIRIVPDGKEEVVVRVKANPRVREIAVGYMKRKGLVYKNEGHQLRDLARNMKTAKKLVDFSDKEIIKCMDYCDDNFGDMWTLETVEKQMSNAHRK